MSTCCLQVGFDPEMDAYPPWLRKQPYSSMLPSIVSPGSVIANVKEDVRNKLGIYVYVLLREFF